MQDVNVLVVFHSRFGATERLALAAAVGAVQGRANIRLRRLPDAVDEATIERVPAWKENRDRMNKEYVAPRESDATWADAIMAGMPAGTDSLSAELEQYFDSIETLRKQGKLGKKIGAWFTQGFENTSLDAAMRRTGLITHTWIELPDTDAPEAARLQGRRVADMARSLRAIEGERT